MLHCLHELVVRWQAKPGLWICSPTRLQHSIEVAGVAEVAHTSGQARGHTPPAPSAHRLQPVAAVLCLCAHALLPQSLLRCPRIVAVSGLSVGELAALARRGLVCTTTSVWHRTRLGGWSCI